MLQKIHTSSRTAEVGACANGMVIAFKNTTLASDTNLNDMFLLLETKSNALTTSYNRTINLSSSKEKDDLRDSKIQALIFFIKGATFNPDTTIQTAAKAINRIIEKYGLSITHENYATETTSTNSLLEDLNAPEIQESIAVLSGCAELIQGVQTAQNDFESTNVADKETNAQDADFVNATTLRTEILKLFNAKMVVYLRAMELVDAATYQGFNATLNEIIEANNITVKKRLNDSTED